MDTTTQQILESPLFARFGELNHAIEQDMFDKLNHAIEPDMVAAFAALFESIAGDNVVGPYLNI